jgi:multisubunit Na+/H+ antiporter MnhB subunit
VAVDRARRAWLVDTLFGGLVGGLVGAIVAVNMVIYSGIEPGYEATIRDVFQQSRVVGVITATVLVAGPVLGVVAARAMRRRRGRYRPSE